MCYLGIFGLLFLKNIVIFEMSTIKFANLANFAEKQSCWKFWPKMRYLGVFWVRTFKKNCHIWNQHTRICVTAKFSKSYFHKKWKCLNLGLKMPYLAMSWAIFFKNYWYIWNLLPQICLTAKFSKNYCHIWNQHPQICEFPKFLEKAMMSKVVTKNPIFRHFPGYYI